MPAYNTSRSDPTRHRLAPTQSYVGQAGFEAHDAREYARIASLMPTEVVEHVVPQRGICRNTLRAATSTRPLTAPMTALLRRLGEANWTGFSDGRVGRGLVSRGLAEAIVSSGPNRNGTWVRDCFYRLTPEGVALACQLAGLQCRSCAGLGTHYGHVTCVSCMGTGRRS